MFEIKDNNNNIIEVAQSFSEACNIIDYLDRTNPAAGPHLTKDNTPSSVATLPTIQPSLIRRAILLLKHAC